MVGIPFLAHFKLGDKLYRHLPKTHPRHVMGRKNPSLAKARLCARGDEIRGRIEFDTSAPTDTWMSSEAVAFWAFVTRWVSVAKFITGAILVFSE